MTFEITIGYSQLFWLVFGALLGWFVGRATLIDHQKSQAQREAIIKQAREEGRELSPFCGLPYPPIPNIRPQGTEKAP
jgi:hypothetical protein